MLVILPKHSDVIKVEEDVVKMFCSNVGIDYHNDNYNIDANSISNLIQVTLKFVFLRLKKNCLKGCNIIDGVDDIILINSFDNAKAFSLKKTI